MENLDRDNDRVLHYLIEPWSVFLEPPSHCSTFNRLDVHLVFERPVRSPTKFLADSCSNNQRPILRLVRALDS